MPILTETTNPQIKNINSQAVNDTTQKANNLVSRRKIIPVRSNDSIFISGKNKIILLDDNILFGDCKIGLLLLLDKNGKEMATVGRLGSGAGQYHSIEGFNVDNYHKQIIVYSNETMSLLKFDFEGKFINKRKLPFYGWDFAVLDSSHLVFFLNQNTNRKSGMYNLLVTDHEGQIEQKLFPIESLPHMVFTYTGFIRQGQSSILFSEPFSDSIYVIKDGTYTPEYTIDFGNKKFPAALKNNSQTLLENNLNYDWVENGVYESNSFLVVKYNEDRKNNYLIYNKKNGKVILSRSIKDDFMDILIQSIAGVQGDTFYSIIDPILFRVALQKHAAMQQSVESFDPELLSLITTNPYGNPIIYSFDFKF